MSEYILGLELRLLPWLICTVTIFCYKIMFGLICVT